MAGLYHPEIVKGGYPVGEETVAEVQDPDRVSVLERRILERWGEVCAVTNELAAVAILAAHAGLHLAVAMVMPGRDNTTTRRMTDV
jgi:hypothetical protein